jgi:hypothetical protein
MKKIITLIIFVFFATTANADVTFSKKITASQQQKVLSTLNTIGGDWSPSKLRVRFKTGSGPLGVYGATGGSVSAPSSFYAGNYSNQYCGTDGKPHSYTYARVLAHEVAHTMNRNYAEHGGANDIVIQKINDLNLGIMGADRDTNYHEKGCF